MDSWSYYVERFVSDKCSGTFPKISLCKSPLELLLNFVQHVSYFSLLFFSYTGNSYFSIRILGHLLVSLASCT